MYIIYVKTYVRQKVALEYYIYIDYIYMYIHSTST